MSKAKEILSKLREYNLWVDEIQPFSKDDMYHYIPKADVLLGYYDIIWPDFKEIQDLVINLTINESTVEDNIAKFFEKGHDKSSIENLFNRLCLYDYFRSDPNSNEITTDMLMEIGELLVETWDARLKLLFPEKKFEVGVYEDEGDVYIYSFQKN